MDSFNIFLLTAKFLNKILFYEVSGVPLIVAWLFGTSIYFSFKLGFPNIKLFKHAIKVIMGKCYSDEDEGFLKPWQSFFISISSTLGLGTIAGVSIAISIAGPGTVIWMMIASFLGMNTVFTEAILSIKYRRLHPITHTTTAGPPRYLRIGLREVGFKKFGFFLALVYSVCSLIGMIANGAIFQAHEAVSILTDFTMFKNYQIQITIVLALLIGFVMYGGMKRGIKVIEKFVPFVSFGYLLVIFSFLFLNYSKIPTAVLLMFKDAFSIKSITAGFMLTMITGIRRASSSNEAGMGTCGIAQATAKTKHPVQQASVASLIPFITTIIFCFLTGIVITISKVYLLANSGDGVVMTKNAFAVSSTIFPYIITLIILVVALSVMISYSYYAQNIWSNIFGDKSKYIFFILYSSAILFSAFINFEELIMIADNFFLIMSIPNIIGLYFMRNIVKSEYLDYLEKYNIKNNSKSVKND